MKELTKKVFYCDHCKKHGLNKGSMMKHEKWCDSNPENKKACSGCMYLEEIKARYTVDEGTESEYERESNAFKCTKLDKMLYPLVVQRKGLNTRYSVFADQEPMPKECEHFKSEYGLSLDEFLSTF
jgi:hypothetical protein